MIDPYKLGIDVFSTKNTQICLQYMRFYLFELFIVAILSIKLLYIFASMFTLNYIYYRVEKKIEA